MPKKCCCSSFFGCFSGNNTESSSPAVVTTLPASTSNDDASSSVPTHNDSGPSGDPSSSTSTDKIIKDGGNNTQSSSSAHPPANNSANNNASPAVVTTPLPASSSQDDASTSSSAKCGLSSSVPTHNDSGTHEAPASGDPCSSTSTVSELTKKIIKVVENEDIILDDLIDDISKLFEIIKTKSSDKKPSTDKYWPTSPFFLKLKDILSEAADGVSALKDLFRPAKSVAQDLLKGIGQVHSAVAVLLVVANILERFETLSANQNECLSVLEEMSNLAQHVKELKERSGLKKTMETSIKRATEMIVEGALMCCTQMSASRISKYFSSTVNKEDLAKFQQRLQKTYRRMDNQMLICILDAVESKNVRPPVKERERSYPEYAVGIEEQLEEVIDLLEWESHKNVLAVMVHGFGGIGKTTLADAVFARLYIEGCKYSMVRLFDDINSTPNIIELQKCMLKDLMLGSREEDQKSMLENIRTFEDGQREIGRMLQKEVAFIYIDNALHKDALEKLLPKDMEKFRKCRLVITTRDTEVRKGCSMDEVKPYPVKYLPSTEAMIFLKQELNYEKTDDRKRLNSGQLHRIVNLCGGIPKLLSVLARFIRYEDRGQEKAFSLVMEMEEKKKWNVRIGDIGSYLFVYDLLPEIVKDPFLDICLFFNGWDWDKVSDIVGESNLDVLEKRGLVKRDKYMTVTVHDVILTVGYEKTEGTRFRFNSKSEIEEFLKKDIPGIKGIWLNDIQGIKDVRLNHIHNISIPATKLDCMSHSLRILALGDSAEVDGTCENIFEEIVFFQGEVPYLPFHVSHSKELKYLRYEPHDWNLLKEMPSNLKYIELNGRLHSEDAFKILSSDLQQRRSLRTLKLVNFARLKNLPEVWAILSHCLQNLELSGWDSLEELPGSISKLQSLTELDMRYCSSLKRLPEDFGSLTLQNLNLSGCHSLEELPGSISKLQSLTELDMRYCSSLKRLPEDFGSLTSLQKLNLSGCNSLEELPGSISKLQSLTDLYMNYCSSLKRLPEDFGSLTSLQNLDLSFCKCLEELPGSISKLQSLTELDMSYSSSLKRLPEDFGSLTSLQKLNLSGCNSLEELPGSISKLQSLTDLYMNYCSSLKRLPEDFGSLTSLQNLDLSGCNSLEELPGSISKLQSLTELYICYCSSLKRLPEDFGSLTSLQKLNLSGCNSLEEPPGSISKLQSLTELDMSNCSSLKRLPEDFGSLTSLQKLNLSGCNSLEEPPGSISKLQSLTELDMSNCSSLKRLPEDFGSLTSLQKLNLSGCNSLEEPPGSISKLQSLTELDMSNCSSLKRLPEDFGSLTLQKLKLSGCDSLEELPGSISKLQSLTELEMRYSSSLKRNYNSLEELPGSKTDLSGLESLEEPPG